ncbi:hypothetical protein M406DRAFT_330389 [Cryphonectria parasitica EP155]|uniref:Uncharacterized protein n=1 Tax=Cryphonectria parasitica (strain ATCC 38755 / EP155) TaxID=660469 RepID=A0A9P4Y4Z4_CRYP1|nr:uncharacterized protein M406DRAFT_330389 [Cryphonectria parasitica EP155]KAF3766585.1 hypothetical protein M406DRAFT_330389 [Cryphonectria parasitica EP155]
MSPISQLRKWFFGSRKLKIQIVGLSGKTEMLYTFKNAVNPGDGCSRFSKHNYVSHLMGPETLVWFIHDCTVDVDAMYLLEFVDTMKSKGAKYIWVLLSKQDLLPQEGREKTVGQHRQKLEDVLEKHARPAGIAWFIVDEPGFNVKTPSYVLSFVKSVTQTVVQLDKEPELKYKKQKSEALSSKPTEKELRDKIITSEIKSGDEFWQAFLSADITSWSHLDHLQAGYLVMLESIEHGHGLLRCATTFLEHLTRLREARPDVFRNSAHFTMTAFWILQLRLATFNFQYDLHDGAPPSKNDFRSILLHTPSLLYGQLWAFYYTKDVLFSADARTNFAMPDIKPFPQVTRPMVTAWAEGKDETQAYEDLEALKGPFTGPERVPRWAFELIRNVLRNDLRRGKALKEGLEELQADTVRLRSLHPELLASGDMPPYSETQAYFWAQLIHIKLRTLLDEPRKDDASATSDGTRYDDLSYEEFKEMSGFTGLEWKEYYSRDVWESVEARIAFVNPDKKPLLDVLKVS